MGRTQSASKATARPSEMVAGTRMNQKAKFHVASKPGGDGPVPTTTDIDEPGAPDPTSDRPERGPSGAATETQFHQKKSAEP